MPGKVGVLTDLILPASIKPPLRSAKDQAAASKAARLTEKISAGAAADSQAKEQVEKSPSSPTAINSTEELKGLIESLNHVLNIFDVEAKIFVDSKTELQVIQLRDVKTQQLIRQEPSEEVLSRVSKTIDLIGLLYDEQI